MSEPVLNQTICHVRQLHYMLDVTQCDRCQQPARFFTQAQRHAIDLHLEHPVLLALTVSVHYCDACEHYFRAQPPFLQRGSIYTYQVVEKAVHAVYEDGMAMRKVTTRMARDFWVCPSEGSVRRWCRDYSKTDIARQVGIHRVTVKDWLSQPALTATEVASLSGASPPPEEPCPPDGWSSWEQVRQVRESLWKHRFLFVHRPERPIAKYLSFSYPSRYLIAGIRYLGRKHGLQDKLDGHKADTTASTRGPRYISRTLDVNRRTVCRYREWAEKQGLLEGTLPSLEELHRLQAETLPVPSPPQNISSVEPYREQVEQWVKENVEMAAIHCRLQERGYSGSYSSVYRFVRKLKPRKPEATVRVECQPGQEAQLDFGYAGPMIDQDTQRRAWAFVMTLSWSRHQYVEFVFDQKIPTWLRLHRNALSF